MPMSDESMSNDPMSTEQQWQSWQPDNLLQPASQPEPTLPKFDSHTDDVQLKAELARLRQQTEQQGFAQGQIKGQEEGKKQGYEAGFQAGREAGLTQGIADAQTSQQAALKEVETWITSFKLSLDNLDSLIPSRLVQLALQAVQNLHGSGQIADGTVLLAQIKRLVKQDELLQGKVCLSINPADQVLVAPVLGETLAAMGWEIRLDAQLAPGGCRVLTEGAEFDATMETRWQTLCQLVREELSA